MLVSVSHNGCMVRLNNATIFLNEENDIPRMLREQLVAPEGLLRSPALGNITKNKYSTDNMSMIITNGSCVRLDRYLDTIFREQKRLMGMLGNLTRLQHFDNRIRRRTPGFLIHDRKNIEQRPSGCLLWRPPGQ